VDVLVRPSLLVMAVVLVALFAPQFELIGYRSPVVAAVVLVLVLYVSVFLHECAHLLVARAYRMPASSITLHLLGGETVIEGESRTPAQELWTSVVGPLTSLALGGLALLLAPGWPPPLEGIALAAAYVNLVLGVVNLVPGLPLDGGHVLRALLWAALRDQARATIAAARCGQVFAVLALSVPFVLSATRGTDVQLLDVALAAVVGWFLWTGAGEAVRATRWAAVLDVVVARDLAVPVAPPDDAPPLPLDLRGVALLRSVAQNPAPVYALVDAGGRPVATLHAADVDAAYRRATA
jgi:Zn-dependent protease